MKYGNRDSYKDAIDRVRAQHADSIAAAHSSIECPRCRTKQVIPDVPGRRVCISCGFEFRPKYNSR